MKTIQTTNGKTVLISDEDFERVSSLDWRAGRGNSKYCYYAVCTKYVDGQRWSMHRFILNAPRGVQVDHKNGNGLDNRRGNLRLASDSQNQANRKLLSLNTSGYRGVTFHRKANKWQAGIKQYGKNFHLGLHDTPEAAARAYDAKAKELFGEFANPNFS